MNTNLQSVALSAALLLLVLLSVSTIQAQTSTFTYQGRLSDSSMPATGTYDFEFALYTTSDTQLGSAIQRNGVTVSNGAFSTEIDFGASVFTGSERFLEIRVKRQNENSYTTLSPRQRIASIPYALRSKTTETADNAITANDAVNANHATTADTATNAQNLGNQPASNYVQTNDPRLSSNGALSGDVTGTQNATVVSSLSGQPASTVVAGAQLANNATDVNTPNTLVKRNASGNFSAGTITANLAGNASTATSATNFTGSLSGDVTGTQSATAVNSVGGQTASSVASATQSVSAATPNNTVNAIVKRDSNGNFSAGTITANLVGNASTATSATNADSATNAQNAVHATNATNAANATNAVNAQTANTATTAGSATNFTGNLAGDVTGTQGATVVNSVGGQSAANVAAASASINTATSNNTANTFVKRDASGNFSAGTITANLAGNATTATTATNATNAATASTVASTAGNSVVTAINTSGSAVNTTNVSGDVELAPSAQQTTSSLNHLINLKLVSTDPVNHKLGTPGANALLSLSASGTYRDDSVHDKERFRVDNDGSVLSVADYTGGINTTAPIEGSGTRFMWYATKAALRAGQIDGTQWDDANIGLYSTALGVNVRALGDWAIAVGKSSVAANTGTVALGEGHTATGANSIALGYGASTSTSAGSPRLGTFVFSDRSTATICPLYINGSTVDSNCQFHPTVTNSFNVRAVNGSFFYTNTALTTGFIFNSTTATMTLTNSKLTMASDGSTTLTSNSGGSAGVTLPAGGGSWNNLSDRNSKDNIKLVNSRDILRKVIALPISTWNYKTQSPSIRHIGAMAQDFQAAFKVGEDEKHISTIDPDGVALAAIQGLNAELIDRDTKIKALEKQTAKLQKENHVLQQELNSFEARIKRLEDAASKSRRTTKRRK